MTAPLLPLHTNEASPEYLSHLDGPYFEPDRLEGCVEEVATLLRQQQAYVKAHPPLGIFRLAAEGSQTPDRGTIQQASSPFQFTMAARYAPLRKAITSSMPMAARRGSSPGPVKATAMLHWSAAV
ncbi:hypothetical protein ACN079_05525 [Pseudomonas sp. ABY48]|uniref:hypothetical protein n=1 Tax=Pseudomonas sp. ABY48 TaxID=3402865 RepID=UPI003B42E8AD